MGTDMAAERLDGYLAHRGFGTRSEMRKLVRRGRVAVNGVVCHDPSQRIAGQQVSVAGVDVAAGPATVTLIMHKPLGYACSHDPAEAPLVDELYPKEFRHLAIETAGRLDRQTSGLLIATTEGELVHQLTNPRKKLTKRYRIGYVGSLTSHAVQRCNAGMMLDGDPRPTLPAKLVLLDPDMDGMNRALIYLNEGRYHQVRRMIAALGGEVVELHRDKIGGLGE
jgi:16S rRNA pseudouridine516 synthase